MNLNRVLRCITVGLLACAVGVWAFAHRTEPMDDFGALGSFDFLSSTGGHVTDRDLSGKVCVFGCFFTCCTTQCPMLTGSMARLQSELKNLPDLRLISLTVDPEHDTPEKLTAYAQTFGAEPSRWLFLTGEQSVVESFVIKQLHQGVEKNTGADAEPGNRYLHSSRLILVDRAGHIRGFFDGTDSAEVDKLRQIVRKLHG
jgi:cytochrome oxidase Cu insertion factor (SCO1/SenC/PrrC family)